MSTPQTLTTPDPVNRPKRKLRPEVVARMSAKTAQHEVADLYAKPLAELTPEELRKMKAAFLLGI